MNKEEITELYSKQAGGLRAKGRYKDAERLAYCDIITSRSSDSFMILS